jgi:hypothetical protein
LQNRIAQCEEQMSSDPIVWSEMRDFYKSQLRSLGNEHKRVR